jgi:TetR/AcrR family transcriptional regulator, tetracycline repressor protein
MRLQRESVARTALQVVDEVGLDGLTMRRLAAELDIQNQSLYWHFANKQALLNCMAEQMITDAFTKLRPQEPGEDWAEWLTAFAHLFRRALLTRRDGARILAEADLSFTHFFDGLESALNVLLNAGFDGSTAIAGMIAVIQFVLGNVFESQADPASHQNEGDSCHLPATKLPVDEQRFPRIAALLPLTEMFSPLAVEARFEAGWSLILDGLRANFPEKR